MFLSSLRSACAANAWFELGLGWLVLFVLQMATSGLVAAMDGSSPSLFWLSISQLGSWLMAAWVMVTINGYPFIRIVVALPNHWAQLLLSVLLALLVLPLAFAVNLNAETFHLPAVFHTFEEAIHTVERLSGEALLKYMGTQGTGALMAKLLVFALIPALAEEAFFRGWMLRTLARKLPPHAAVIVTAVVFSLLHFQMYGFFSRTLLGIVLGYTVWYSQSLLPAMLTHFTFNAVSVIGVHLMAANHLPLDGPEPAPDFSLTLLSGLSVASVLVFFSQLRSPVQERD